VKLLFDSSVWIEHLRRGALDAVLPVLRGKLALWMDGVVAAELRAGCRGKREERVVKGLLGPFERAGRVAVPAYPDFRRAAGALSRLRARGRTLSNPGGALLDALIGTVAVRIGAMVITTNMRDFEAIATQLPLMVEPLDGFAARLGTT
jgi:predicted nucleic acid-binding protein